MQGLLSLLSLFRNESNKINETRALMLDSIYHMTLRLLKNLISGVKRYNFVNIYVGNCVMDIITFSGSL